LNLVDAADGNGRGELAHRGRTVAAPREIDPRSNLLLERQRGETVECRVEQPRLAVGAEQAILGQPVAAGRRVVLAGKERRILGVKADAAEEGRRPVLAEQVPPADFEERPRRHFELFADRAAELVATGLTHAPLQTAPEP